MNKPPSCTAYSVTNIASLMTIPLTKRSKQVRDEATHNLLSMLPPRELEIAQLVGTRSICTATKLASHLNISEKTARNYINNIKIHAEPHYGWRLSWMEPVHYF